MNDIYKSLTVLPSKLRWSILSFLDPIKIISIDNIYALVDKNEYLGYNIELSYGIWIQCLISSCIICCEEFGYSTLAGLDISNFIDAHLIDNPDYIIGDEKLI